jgi:hypothetical protein
MRSRRTDALVCHTFAVNRKTGLAEDVAVPPVEVLRGEAAQEFGTVPGRPAECLVAPPARDRAMVA